MTNQTNVTCDCHNNLQVPTADVSDDVLDTLERVGITLIATALRRLGIRNSSMPGVTPRTPRRSFAGTAFTYRTLPVREDLIEANAESMHPVAYDSLGKRQVLVIDTRGDLSARVMGDLYATRLTVRGAAAVVTDGAVGDTRGMEELDLAVYARGLHVRGFSAVHFAADFNVPISCAGVLVIPGDVIVGDADGVIVVPQALAAQTAKIAVDQNIEDAFKREKLLAGHKLTDVYPLKAQYREEFEAWRRRAFPS